MFQVKSGVSALVKLFYQQEELARTEEKKTDAILDGEQKPQASNQEEFYEETVAMCKFSYVFCVKIQCWDYINQGE